MQTPTQDKELKKYLAQTIKRDMRKVFNHIDWQFVDKKEMDEFFNKCATNIQRHLNDLGYERPKDLERIFKLGDIK